MISSYDWYFCSINATNNLTSKKQRCALSDYQHAGTRIRKGRKRCYLFYGGERDKLKWMARFDEHKKETKFEVEKSGILLISDWWTSIGSFCKLSKFAIYVHVGGAYDKFPDFFGMGTFIDNTLMKI